MTELGNRDAAIQGRTLAPITWDEIGRTESALVQLEVTPKYQRTSQRLLMIGRRFVWLSPRKLHLHPNLERNGIASTTAEHNKLPNKMTLRSKRRLRSLRQEPFWTVTRMEKGPGHALQSNSLYRIFADRRARTRVASSEA